MSIQTELGLKVKATAHCNKWSVNQPLQPITLTCFYMTLTLEYDANVSAEILLALRSSIHGSWLQSRDSPSWTQQPELCVEMLNPAWCTAE